MNAETMQLVMEQLGSKASPKIQLLMQLLQQRETAGSSEEPPPESAESGEAPRGRRLERLLRAHDFLVSRNADLSAACGACVCWGELQDCTLCDGEGVPGAFAPEEDVFMKYIAPVAQRIGAVARADARSGNDNPNTEGKSDG